MLTIAMRFFAAAFFLLSFVAIGHTQGNPLGRDLAALGPNSDVIGVASAKLLDGEDVPIGTIEEWSNPETGGAGTVELVEFSEYQGLPCRKLVHRAKFSSEGDLKEVVITRCKTADGIWKIL